MVRVQATAAVVGGDAASPNSPNSPNSREGGEGGPRHARAKAVERLPVVVFDVGRTGACKRLDRPVGVAQHAHSVPLREVRIELDVYEASLHAGDCL